MKNDKVQLNMRVRQKLATAVRTDAVKCNKTLDAIADTIIGEFFTSFSIDERRRLYDAAQPKIYGPKIFCPSHSGNPSKGASGKGRKV